jgi:hypothetical protein
MAASTLREFAELMWDQYRKCHWSTTSGHSFQRHVAVNWMTRGRKALIDHVVGARDAAAPLPVAEEFPDQLVSVLDHRATCNRAHAICFGWNDGGGAVGTKFLMEYVIFEAFTGNQNPGLYAIKLGICPGAIRPPAWQSQDVHQIPNAPVRALILEVRPTCERPVA